MLGLRWRVKTYVLLPYAVFCMTYAASKYYYAKGLQSALGNKPRLNYLDYYLLIGPKRGKDRAYPVSLIDSPAGEDSCELKFPVTADVIADCPGARRDVAESTVANCRA
jgi:hypothetical protein